MRVAAIASMFLANCRPTPPEIPASVAPRPSSSVSIELGERPFARAEPSSNVATEPARSSACVHSAESVACQSFSSPESAFLFVLEKKPKLLAIGEAHAQKGTENLASATRRFGEHLLPLLKGRASDLLLELWLQSGSCGAVEAKVSKKQQPVTKNQAVSNQNEYVWLGHRAKALGIAPHALTPSCEDYRRIASAGPEDIQRMLEMIAQASAKKLLSLFGASTKTSQPGLILAYGGALHNDRFPRQGREAWSFGPELARKTGGEYVELDLIVPEYVKDTPAWRAFPWYAAYAPQLHSQETLLFTTGEGSFTLIFPKTSRPTLESSDAAPEPSDLQ
jgi:hypothetical protein